MTWTVVPMRELNSPVTDRLAAMTSAGDRCRCGMLRYAVAMSDPVAEITSSARERKKVLAVRSLVSEPEARVRVKVGDQSVELPRSLVRVLRAAADAFEESGRVAVVSEEAEVSPAEAAKLLGVSRQYVDRLIENGVLPVRRLPGSSYRKIPVRAVLAERAVKEHRRAAIRRIVDTALEAGLEY